MAPTVSKTTSDQLKYSAAVESATAEHGERIAQKVMKLVWGAETPPVSLVVVVRALLALLRVASRTLRTSDAHYMDELADDDPARSERDAAADALQRLLLGVQSSIIGAFGEAYADKLGLVGSLERRPDMLLRRAEGVVRQMRSVDTPTPLLEGVTVDVPLLATRMDAAANRLATALSTVTTEKSEDDAALVARDQAAEHWDRVVRLVANFMVGLAEVAGEAGIAARIRPTARRLRGGLTGDTVAAQPTAGSGDAGPTADASTSAATGNAGNATGNATGDAGNAAGAPNPNDPLVNGPTGSNG